jgi:hypothetical protein
MILICLGLDHAWVLIVYLLNHARISPQQRTITIVTKNPVDEQIGCWNMVEKQYEEIECVAFIMSYNSICSMCGCWWHILPLLPLSYSEKENWQAQGRNWKSKWI